MGTLIARVESADGRDGAAAGARQGAAPKRSGPRKGGRPARSNGAAAKKSSASSAPSKTAPMDITIPDIGDFKDVPVIEILVKVGDTVEAEQPLVTLESDKATMDVPSPAAGKISEIVVKVGDKVSMGSLIGKLDAGGRPGFLFGPGGRGGREGRGGRRRSARHLARCPDDLPPRPAEAVAGPALADFSGVFAGPAVRRLARELGLDLNLIKGTGDKGRITREDVKAALVAKRRRGACGGGAALPAVPPSTSPNSGRSRPFRFRASRRFPGRGCTRLGSTSPMSRIRTKRTSPISTPSEKLSTKTRRRTNQSLTASRCCRFLCGRRSRSLKAFPTFNAALSPGGDSLILRRYWHIGVAVDTPDGLVVAVVKDVDQKGVIDLSRELGALSEKARGGKLAPAEMQGATFTISSLGGIGGTAFTPIVNAPEVAILGVVRSKMAPVWDGTAFQPRLMLPLCLSYDHRVIDGAAARPLHAPSRGPPGGHAAHYLMTAAR